MKSQVIAGLLLAVAVAGAQPRPGIVRETRIQLNRGDFDAAVKVVDAYAAREGKTAAWLEAYSWLARNRLAAKDFGAANDYAAKAREAALAMLKTRGVDDETSLPLALGASIEVMGQALEAQGQKSEAVSFLQAELARWRATSMRTRIQKNLNLVTLEGKAAPGLEMKEWLGAKPPAWGSLKGKTVVLFFWAHWCGDCKQQAPVLARLKEEMGERLVVLGPTQPYGYVARGEEAGRAEELKYIEEVRQKFYAGVEGMTVPVSEETFRNWGASTTPTLAVIDPAGVVKLYHPGRMTYEELRPYLTQAARTE